MSELLLILAIFALWLSGVALGFGLAFLYFAVASSNLAEKRERESLE